MNLSEIVFKKIETRFFDLELFNIYYEDMREGLNIKRNIVKT
jgi:hypothetical protein